MTPSAKLKKLWDARIGKIMQERDEARARLAAAEAAMKAAASLPGRLWLTGQLALAEFLGGEGGENLDYALEQYEAAKGGRDAMP